MLNVQKSDLKSFEEQGFMLIKGVLDPEDDIKPVEEEYSIFLNSIIEKLYDAGKLSSTYRELPFLERFCKVLFKGLVSIRQLDITLPPNYSEDAPIYLGPTVFHNILRNPRILEVIEMLIGPEIYCNAVQHTRIKPREKDIPEDMLLNNLVAATSWHQDLGVLNPEADDTEIISVWVAMTDVNENNGCLVIIPGSHRQELVQHCHNSGANGLIRPIHIPDDKLSIGEPMPVIMKAGDALFFQKTLMHSSQPNTSDSIRWSFDLRYNQMGKPNGRSWLPGFIARSAANPDSVLTDAEEWAQNWRDAHTRLLKNGDSKKPHNRWLPDDPVCA